MTADRPLTDAQERALIALDDADGDGPPEWHLRGDRRSRRSFLALERQGLVEHPPSGWHAWRITGAGLAMLRSMGD